MDRSALTRRLPIALVAGGLAVFAASPALAGADHGRSEGRLVVWDSRVPDGATARVHAVYDQSGTTRVALHLKGFAPRTDYGAHAHVRPCGLNPSDSGPHFQNV